MRPTCSTHLLVRPLASFTTAVLMKKIQSRSHMTLARPRLKPRYTPVNTVLSLAKKTKKQLQLSALLPPLWLQLSAACCRVLSAQQPQQSNWHERMGGPSQKAREEEREWEQRDDLCLDAWEKIDIFASTLRWAQLGVNHRTDLKLTNITYTLKQQVQVVQNDFQVQEIFREKRRRHIKTSKFIGLK